MGQLVQLERDLYWCPKCRGVTVIWRHPDKGASDLRICDLLVETGQGGRYGGLRNCSWTSFLIIDPVKVAAFHLGGVEAVRAMEEEE